MMIHVFLTDTYQTWNGPMVRLDIRFPDLRTWGPCHVESLEAKLEPVSWDGIPKSAAEWPTNPYIYTRLKKHFYPTLEHMAPPWQTSRNRPRLWAPHVHH